MVKTNTSRNLADFAKLNTVATHYGPIGPNTGGYRINRISQDFNTILNKVMRGSIKDRREISRSLYRAGTIYTQIIEYFVSLPTLQYFATLKQHNPNLEKRLNDVIKFADNTQLDIQFRNILRTELIEGCFYGILCEDKKAQYNYILPIPEEYVETIGNYSSGTKAFAIKYDFFSRQTEEQLLLLFSLLPVEMLTAIKNKEKLIIVPVKNAVGFEMPNMLPPFLFTVVAFYDYIDRLNLDRKKIEQDLILLLTQKLPIKNDGELIFTMDEAAELHKNLANVLKQNGLADAVTTFGDISAVKTETAQTAARAPMHEYLKNIPASAGINTSIFIPTHANDIKYSIQKDSGYIVGIVERYNQWLNQQAKTYDMEISLSFLPITWANKEQYIKNLQTSFSFGFNKIQMGMMSGLKQSEVIAQLQLEQPLQKLLIPPQNANTISSTQDQGPDNGRPEEGL